MKKCWILLVIMVQMCIAFAQTKEEKLILPTQTVRLIFKNTVGDSLLQTGINYVNAFDEPFSIRAFKYYISDIQLQYADSSICKINKAPHLVNEIDSTSKQLSFIAPEGTISGIHFLLGVDSIVNTTGVQTGDLDPAKGMYWIWNTGYIMAKLEGSSPVAKSPGHQFTYDIGGYKTGENAARKISLFIPPDANQKTSVTKNIIINADILKWFNGANSIKIGEHPMCHEPGTLATQIADNYEHMFSVKTEE